MIIGVGERKLITNRPSIWIVAIPMHNKMEPAFPFVLENKVPFYVL